jgi:hypothetical protein
VGIRGSFGIMGIGFLFTGFLFWVGLGSFKLARQVLYYLRHTSSTRLSF